MSAAEWQELRQSVEEEWAWGTAEEQEALRTVLRRFNRDVDARLQRDFSTFTNAQLVDLVMSYSAALLEKREKK